MKIRKKTTTLSNYSNPLFRRHGVTLIVFRADLFQSFSEYAKRADEMSQRTQAIPPAPGFEEVLLPGMPEAKAQNIRQEDGIPIADDIWQSIAETASALGIKT